MTRPALLVTLICAACLSAQPAGTPKLGPPPPVPEAPRTGPAPSAADSPDLKPPAAPAPDDPFQQAPRDAGPAPGNGARASAAFADKRYAQAGALFAEADRNREPLTEAQRDEWAYCRLHGVAMRLNRGPQSAADLAELGREAQAAMKAGSDRLRPFGTRLLDDIRRRSPSAAAGSADWQAVPTGSFRVLHQGRAELAGEVGQVAEAARRAMYERWVGPPAADWGPKCDVYLHPTAAEYAKATGKPADHPGHATVRTKGGQVVSRRIDLRADEPNLLDGTLPHEVTQVILAELFADQPLPRWAAIGIAALSESPESVARYRRAVPQLLKERKMFAVGPFLNLAGFPDAPSVTAFYAESVSLVSYLVELKGPKAFTAFLQEGPRRGYAKALATHYGFKDPAELQEKWVRHSLGGE